MVRPGWPGTPCVTKMSNIIGNRLVKSLNSSSDIPPGKPVVGCEPETEPEPDSLDSEDPPPEAPADPVADCEPESDMLEPADPPPEASADPPPEPDYGALSACKVSVVLLWSYNLGYSSTGCLLSKTLSVRD